MKAGNYGSVLIHIKNGVITGIVDKNDFNCDAFVSHVENPVSRVVVKSYKVKKPLVDDSLLTKESKDDQSVVEMTEKVSQNDDIIVNEQKE